MDYAQLVKIFGNINSVELDNNSITAVIECESRNYSYMIKVKSTTSTECVCRFEIRCQLKNIVVVVTETNADIAKLLAINMINTNMAGMIDLGFDEVVSQIETLLKYGKLTYKVTIEPSTNRKDPLVKMLICYIAVVLLVMILGFAALLIAWLVN